ncbi:lytic transglycosylase domain-containing protein [Hydrogenophaga crassostreae]|nr:lytic transglycosylase domain-containing protein [Hydrogenophaga crassostreae]
MLDCPDLAVPGEVMQHVVHVESSRNPFAIGVVGGYLARQPTSLDEALAAIRQLKEEGYNFSVGIAQVNRYNLAKYGLSTYADAFDVCANLKAGSRILRECYDRAQDWGKAFSCYYSGNFSTGFEHGYVQKIFASIRKAQYSVTEPKASVRIIPYNSNKPRKPAKEDSLPLVAPASPAVGLPKAAPVPVDNYPEPYAIRKYLPSTPLSVTANAYANAAAKPAGLQSAAETAENRPAIPVPGPGALPSAALQTSAGVLSQIPTQVVGVNGDPYKTRIVPASNSTGLPANQLPLPNPDAVSMPAAATGVRKAQQESSADNKAMAARKGGSLLHSTESSGQPGNTAVSGADTSKPASQGNRPSSDGSFVF